MKFHDFLAAASNNGLLTRVMPLQCPSWKTCMVGKDWNKMERCAELWSAVYGVSANKRHLGAILEGREFHPCLCLFISSF